MLTRSEQDITQPKVATSHWRTSTILLAVSVLCVCIGLLQRPPTATDASQGLFSDLVRLLPFALTGFLSSRQRRSPRFVIAWAAALNLIDKGAVGLGVAYNVAGVGTVALVFGVSMIWAATFPLALVLCMVIRMLTGLFAADGEGSLSRWANVLVFAGLGAVLVPIVHAVNGYAVLVTYDVPLFALWSSYHLVPVLQMAFMAIATIALVFYGVGSVSKGQLSSAPIVGLGVLLLIASAVLFVVLDSIALLKS